MAAMELSGLPQRQMGERSTASGFSAERMWALLWACTCCGLLAPALFSVAVYGQDAGAAQSQPLAAAPGQALQDFHLTGRVSLPDGSPAAGATVRLDLLEAPLEGQREYHRVVQTCTCDAEGRYDFGPLPVPMFREDRPGSGRLFASLEGYGFAAINLDFMGLPTAGESGALFVVDEEATCELTLTESWTAVGTVVGPDDEPLEAAEVAVYVIGYERAGGGTDYVHTALDFLAARTDADGAFRLSGLPRGATLTCRVEKDGYVPAHPMLTEGENRVALELAGAIEGRVVFGDTGQPAIGVRVSVMAEVSYPARRRGTTEAAATTDERGAFRVGGLPESLATVNVDPGAAGLDYAMTKITDVAVFGGRTTDGVAVVLSKGGLLTGSVIDETSGEPVADALVIPYRVVNARWGDYGLASTDAEGRYSVRLPEGGYALTYHGPEGYLPNTQWRFETIPQIVVRNGETTEAPVFELVRAAYLAIRVRTPDGRPAANVAVAAVGDMVTPWGRIPPTNVEGVTRVRDLQPGRTVQFKAADHDGMLRGEGQITPVMGEENELVITLAEAVPCTVAGRVTDADGKPIAGAEIWLAEPTGPNRWASRRRGTSGADGQFEIRGLAPGGERYVETRARGYGRGASDRVTLTAGQTYDVGVLVLPLADQELAGRVVDRGGKPLPGVRVNTYGEKSEYMRTVTNKDGEFRFEGLVDETIRIVLPDKRGWDGLVRERVQAGTTDLVIEVPTEGEEPEPDVVARVGEPTPELVLEEGAGVRLADYTGRSVLLVFVSIGSEPCAALLVRLRELQGELGADKLGVIAVHDRTATPQQIEAFRGDRGIEFPIVRVPPLEADVWHSDTWRTYGVKGMPAAVLIDAEGKVAAIAEAAKISELLQGLQPGT